MIAILLVAFYILISTMIYAICDHRFKQKKLVYFKAPKSKFVYYFLSFTWGLPMTLVGCIVALILTIGGKRPKKYGRCWCFEFDVNYGLELGIFFIAPKGNYTSLKNHEHGHGIQNLWLGIFTPLVVSIPSAVRYWIREIKHLINPTKKLSSYDSIWFEGTASSSGDKFMENY